MRRTRLEILSPTDCQPDAGQSFVSPCAQLPPTNALRFPFRWRVFLEAVWEDTKL